MGARRGLGAAAVAVVLLAARAEAATVWEPLARLYLEGSWDSNALHDGRGGDRVGRVSPDVGLRLRNPLLDLIASYGGDWATFARLKSEGTWNHRGLLRLETTPTRRLTISGRFRVSYAYDPVGLAMLGVFRPTGGAALAAGLTFRAEYRATERVDVAATLRDRAVQFDDRTGGATHTPGVEALWRTDRRVDFGAGYRFGIYQAFEPGDDEIAFSHGVQGRVRWRASRRFTLDASAGPALWRGSEESGVVPEGSLQLLGTGRGWEVRTELFHGLALGTTARPGLVDALEAGGRKLLGRRYELRGGGGLWRAGRVPGGEDAVTGYAMDGEAALLVGGGVRVGVAASHFERLDDAAATYRRTTVTLRLGWELPVR
jgi:hypothetical protein